MASMGRTPLCCGLCHRLLHISVFLPHLRGHLRMHGASHHSSSLSCLSTLPKGGERLCGVAKMFVLDRCSRLSWWLPVLVGSRKRAVPLLPGDLSTLAFTCAFPHRYHHVPLLLCGVHDLPPVSHAQARCGAPLGGGFSVYSCQRSCLRLVSTISSDTPSWVSYQSFSASSSTQRKCSREKQARQGRVEASDNQVHSELKGSCASASIVPVVLMLLFFLGDRHGWVRCFGALPSSNVASCERS